MGRFLNEPRYESDMYGALIFFMRKHGYHCLIEPEGGGLFDCVVVNTKGDDVGCIELKLTDWRKLSEQLKKRKRYFDWVCALMPKLYFLNKLIDDGREDAGLMLYYKGKVIMIKKPVMEEPRWKYSKIRLRQVAEFERAGIPNEVVWNDIRGISQFAIKNRCKYCNGMPIIPEDMKPDVLKEYFKKHPDSKEKHWWRIIDKN